MSSKLGTISSKDGPWIVHYLIVQCFALLFLERCGKLLNEFRAILPVVSDSALWPIALNKILQCGP